MEPRGKLRGGEIGLDKVREKLRRKNVRELDNDNGVIKMSLLARITIRSRSVAVRTPFLSHSLDNRQPHHAPPPTIFQPCNPSSPFLYLILTPALPPTRRRAKRAMNGLFPSLSSRHHASVTIDPHPIIIQDTFHCVSSITDDGRNEEEPRARITILNPRDLGSLLPIVRTKLTASTFDLAMKMKSGEHDRIRDFNSKTVEVFSNSLQFQATPIMAPVEGMDHPPPQG
uniref:Uncharacterized protein n=1 Tax=Cannabis sativa TaxID=3483 RepID=A0A803QJ93_CANSA